MACGSCGAELLANARFCASCGAAVAVSPPAPVAFDPRPARSPAPDMLYNVGNTVGRQMQTTSTNAVISLVAGIAGWTVLPILGAIIAVIFGRMAKKEIRASNGTLQGETFATIGLIAGFAELSLLALSACGAGLFFFVNVILPIMVRAWFASGSR
jgi:Domain of unknown function (DUF4190)/zinc-ribbon domain